jgi:uncharacterized repeat protein (TIGR04052 family)
VRVLKYSIVLSLCAACAPQRDSLEIPFDVSFGGRELTCEDSERSLSLTDLRFYVHKPRIVTADGREVPIDLIADGIWQNDTVALLDFENGEGACLNGSQRTNISVRGLVADVAVGALMFEIGVPESLNHADPLVAAAPLNYSEMHWHWASGYRFFRGGVQNSGDGFWMHLGSNRCEGTIGDIKGCRSANRPRIRLDGFQPGKHKVVIDLAILFSSAILEDGMPTNCSSGPEEQACERPFAAFGIDFSTGESATTATPFELELIE